MSILPQGENLRRAVQWISDQRQEKNAKPMAKIIAEACFAFNLSPADALYLERWVETHIKDG